MTDENTVELVEQCYQISLHSLRIDTVTNFDMYLKHAGSTGDKPFVLYRKKNLPFTEGTRNALAEHGNDVLYIDISDKKKYQTYLETNLDAIIADETVPPEKKSNIAYTCATGLAEDLLEHPRSGEHINRSKAVISNVVKYMLDDARAFFTLTTTMSFDYYTYTHSVNVAVFGIALAQRLGRFNSDEIYTLGAGLMLHDIGKGLIDPRILNKPGKLDREEWAEMKRHPRDGARILRKSGQVSEKAILVVECHHEKLDGSGYPSGLRGRAVHPFARIAALADIFDALTTQRSYRTAERSFPALQIMRDEMKGQVDQELFWEFVHLMGAEKETYQ